MYSDLLFLVVVVCCFCRSVFARVIRVLFQFTFDVDVVLVAYLGA